MLDLTVLPTRWGYIIGGINETCTFGGTTVATRANNIDAQYNTYAAQREVTNDLFSQMTNIQSDLSDWTNFLSELMSTTISTMCRDDTVRPTSDDLDGWFAKLNRDMISQSGTFWRPTVTGTVAAATTLGGSNVGDGYFLSSVTEPIDGITTYYAHAEVVRAICISSSYDDSATLGSEVFSVQGETSVDSLDPRWPKGSGLSTTITAVTPGTAGILTGGGLDDWDDANTLSDWTSLGSTGTALARSATSPYDSSPTSPYFAEFTGDGSTVLGIYQQLIATDVDVVNANTNYAVQFWYKKTGATAISSGQLRIAITNSSGTVLTDNAGTSLSTTIAAATINGASSWTRGSVAFALPKNLASGTRLEFRFSATNGTSSPLDSGAKVGIDYVTMVEMTRLYNGGPYIAIVSGATGFAVGDGFTDTIANNKTTTNFVRSLDRIFDLKGNDIRLQTAVSFTINDTSFIL